MSESSEGGSALEPWLRVGAIVLSQVAALVLVVVLFRVPGFAAWSGSPAGVYGITGLSLLAALGAVVVYERARGAGEFGERLGLRRPGREVVMYAIGGLIYGLGVCYLLRHSEGLAKVAESLRLRWVPSEGPVMWSVFAALLVLVGPVVEEIFMRGFLFRSFLKNYGVAAGTGCTVMLGVLTHWRSVSASLGFLGFFVVSQAALCLVWWRKRNLWYCIAMHSGYNLGVVIFPTMLEYLSGR